MNAKITEVWDEKPHFRAPQMFTFSTFFLETGCFFAPSPFANRTPFFRALQNTQTEIPKKPKLKPVESGLLHLCNGKAFQKWQ